MWYKPYGKTGKEVSVIGFGGMRFPKPAETEAMAEIVHYAHNKGINYFDTAPYYCDDKSEEIMGCAFKTMKRNTYYVSSKCGEADGGKFRASLEKSLKRLGVDYVDFFHVWCLLWPNQLKERTDGGAIAAALKAKEEGLIKHVVVSTHLNGDDIAAVLDTGHFEGLTIGYNALNFPFRQKGLEAAQKHNIGVATMNPLGGGLIARNAERLGFLKAPGDRSVVEAALRFNVSQPAITMALVGFSGNQEIDQAVAAVENFTPYSAEHIEKVKAQISKSFDGFCTGCEYCLPCPANISIPRLMDGYNQKILGGNDQDVLNRLKWHWNVPASQAAECIQCGQCEDQCTQHLPIRERLAMIAGLQPAESK